VPDRFDQAVVISIVSHGHGRMVVDLIDQLRQFPEIRKIILTRNIPEDIPIESNDLVEVIDNSVPKGFGANHNAAFARCHSPYYCVLNPDIILTSNPFPALLECLRQSSAAIAAPLIIAPTGEIEDSARHFPTVGSLLRKALRGDRGCHQGEQSSTPFFPDWVAGMFMLFKSAAYRDIGGFDEAYFLYYEDVDICWRLRDARLRVVVCPAVHAVHDARRASRRSLQHMRWHMMSMGRYLWRQL
jgi:GT2 family glycosyltransferase